MLRTSYILNSNVVICVLIKMHYFEQMASTLFALGHFFIYGPAVNIYNATRLQLDIGSYHVQKPHQGQ